MRRMIFGFSLAVLLLADCSRESGTMEGPLYQVIPLERRDLVVTVSASGSLEPLRSVEVKSKASGEIVAMPVELGDRLAKGALLVKVDPRDVNNQLEQAAAALEVARTRLQIAERQKERSAALLAEGSVSVQEHEQVLLEHATARSEEVRARTNLEQAKERVDDTEIRCPIAGTVMVKAVEQGQIISSATSQVSGGTTLLTLANLDTLQVRTLVDETDIGKIRPGLQAEISVEAYPRELFTGHVLKVEPQAVTVQNVTTFPVLVHIVNERGLLMPGMNVDVEIRTDAREDALTLPTEALRTERDYLVAAGALGLDSEEALALFESTRGEENPREGKPSVVFLVEDGKPRPVPVGVGVSNWDFAEILWGVSESDSVAATLSTSMLMQQERWRNRMSRFSSMGGFKKTDEQKAGASQSKGGAPTRPPEGGESKKADKDKPSEHKGSGSP